MRVTHVITRLIVGGAQENTVATVLGLRQRPDVQVRLIAGPPAGPEGSLLETMTPASRRLEGHYSGSPSATAELHSLLTLVPQLVRPIHPWKDWLALRRLTKIFRQTRPDLVHTHSGKAGLLGRLAAERAGVPLIVHTIHGPSFGSFQGPLARWLFRGAERYVARCTTHFVVVAEAMQTQYLAAGIGQPGQYTKIFSGFSLAPYLSARNDPALRARYGLQPDDFVIGQIARLFKLKGHDDLFAAASELVKLQPEAKFLLVGDGPWRARFEARARALGLERRFIFTGLVAPQEVAPLVGMMDALVHLSRREGLARALPQALAAGKPVVAYDCDGAREVCFEGLTGFLLRPGDVPSLQDRLLRLAGDAALRERLGRAGREFVRQHFAVEKMVDAIYTLYLKLAGDANMTPTRTP